jgi:hypothetical protein
MGLRFVIVTATGLSRSLRRQRGVEHVRSMQIVGTSREMLLTGMCDDVIDSICYSDRLPAVYS